MSNYVVYTAITGGYDDLKEGQNTKGADFIAYTDVVEKNRCWEIRPPYDRFKDQKRNARIQKLLPHIYFEADASMWMDGTITLLEPMPNLVDEWLDGYDIAVMEHFSRNCLYEEGNLERALGKGNQPLIKKELEWLVEQGWPEDAGLVETNMILRRHNETVERFNNAWWAHVTRWDQRDQKTFCYIADKVGARVNYLEGNIRKHPYFKKSGHKK